MSIMKNSSRNSALPFTIIVISLLFVNGHGMKYSRSKESEKKDDIKTNIYNVAPSSRYETRVNRDETLKEVYNTDITTTTPFSTVSDKCEVKINNKSNEVFQKILKHYEPHFVQFRIKFSQPVNSTKDVFQPGRWYWTYQAASKPYQFLSWDLFYGIFSFGLLDHKTSLVPFVKLNLNGHCNLTLGTENTTQLITKAFIPVVSFTSAPELHRKYTESYFCYTSVKEDFRNTLSYHAAVYLFYPVIGLDYKCCLLKYKFTEEAFRTYCSHDVSHMKTWTNVFSFNIILGILIIAYCPILIFRLFAWLGESDKTDNEEHGVDLMRDIYGLDGVNEHDDWIYANGKSPLTFFDVISFKGLGVDKIWPVLVSRLRRSICLLLAPSFIYIEILMFSRGIGVWKKGDKITIKDFVDVGKPVGFLSVLGDANNSNKVFVPAFGGPIGISILYFILGFSYLVLPKCLKQHLENGLPNSDVLTAKGRMSNLNVIKSPLFFGAKDIIKTAQINVNRSDLEPGYSKCLTLMRCNFYMLFTIQFWRHVCYIQTSRVSWFTENMSFLKCLLSMLCTPVYVVLCSFEILLCILYFGIPFIFVMVVMVNGAMKMIPYLREHNTFSSYLFSVRFTRGLGAVVIFVTSLLFSYCVFLLVVGSFKFISELITYCFVAVIIYPSVSFGNLFLLIVIVYYIIRQLKYFSYIYTSLLSTAVEVCKRISGMPNHITCYNGHLLLSNVGFENLREVEINGRVLDISRSFLINTNTDNALKIKLKDKCFGIPKDLFNSLIKKYRPVHTNVLSLLLRVSILICCIILLLSITHTVLMDHEDQISDVLHVVFIIAVGALPKLLETNFINQNNISVEKIEKRYIEQSIVEYWTQRDRLTRNELN